MHEGEFVSACCGFGWREDAGKQVADTRRVVGSVRCSEETGV